MLRRFVSPLATCLVLLGLFCSVRTFGPNSSDLSRTRCQLRIGASDQPIPIYFGGTVHEGAPSALVPAGTYCYLEQLPVRSYDDSRDFWFLVTIAEGELAGQRAWALSKEIHPSNW